MSAQDLVGTAKALVADDKGDESTPTCNRRFAAQGIPQTEEARCAYRELLVTTPGLGECISGVILYDETIRQKKKDGTSLMNAVTSAGIILGTLEIWHGEEAHVPAAQRALYQRAACNRAARRGQYTAAMEGA